MVPQYILIIAAFEHIISNSQNLYLIFLGLVMETLQAPKKTCLEFTSNNPKM